MKPTFRPLVLFAAISLTVLAPAIGEDTKTPTEINLDNIQTAIDTIHRIVPSHELVLDDPEPLIAVSNLGDSSVDLVVRPWCKNADYWTVRFDLLRSLKEGLEAAGCSIPYPQQDVHMYQVAI